MKSPQQIPFLFPHYRFVEDDFILFEKIIIDRGSQYSVAGGKALGKESIKAFIKQLKSYKGYQKASHHSWAIRIQKDQGVFEVKNDDGEAGAGSIILRTLQKENIVNTLVVVTRWFGGVPLHADRFKHIQDATHYFIKHASWK